MKNKPTVMLSHLEFDTSKIESPYSSFVGLFDHENGIFSIQIGRQENERDGNLLTGELVEQILQTFEAAQKIESLKVLIISGTDNNFLTGAREEYNEALNEVRGQKLFRAIASFPYPVIAVMKGDAVGAGFLAGALADFMVCSETGNYYYTNLDADFYPSATEEQVLKERFGEIHARDFLYQSLEARNGYTGLQLRDKGWTCPVVPKGQVEDYSFKLASTLAKNSRKTLRLLKLHLSRNIIELVNNLEPIKPLVPAENSDTGKDKIKSPVDHIGLEEQDESVLVIKIGVDTKNNGLKKLVKDVGFIFNQVEKVSRYKSIVLTSAYPDFLPDLDGNDSLASVSDFARFALDAPVPVVAALESDRKGFGWFVALFCDAAVYCEKGIYSAKSLTENALGNTETIKEAVAIFTLKLGDDFGKQVIFTKAKYTGVDMVKMSGTMKTARKNQVLSSAIQLAKFWTKVPHKTLAAWKKDNAQIVREVIKKCPEWSVGNESGLKPKLQEPVTIELNSKVVRATAHPDGILVVKMEDREAKNMFSDQIVQGMHEVFSHIEERPVYKVIILTGYDNYFASGGTKENLLSIQEGKTKFTDNKIYQLPMVCKVPVISAMQGHSIGGGWSLGMFADFVFFSEESKYFSPYMRYGFTPGAGATFIFPQKIGYDLSKETLLSGQEYAGLELKKRGLTFSVLPREKVLSAAMSLARQIVETPRNILVALKRQTIQHLVNKIEGVYNLELAMHDETFVKQSEALKDIESNFYEITEDSHNSSHVDGVKIERAAASSSDGLAEVKKDVKEILAEELHMHESDINDNKPFVDHGLDSIIGVTLIRRINEKYKTSIEATKVYSYPTLNKLSQFVKEEAEKLGKLTNDVEQKYSRTAKISAPKNQFIAQPYVNKLVSWRDKQISRGDYASDSISRQPIAVIGMAGQFPEAKNIEEFWQNIAEGKNCISEVSPDRWNSSLYYQKGEVVPGKTNCKWMGLLEEYDLFDPAFFNISPKEAISMDPQQRLFLQACWHTVENAGYNAQSLSGSKCGVFVGVGTGDYSLLSRDLLVSAQGFTGNANSILGARISYILNLQGPCWSVDTACSSSLVAISNACDSLNFGSCDLALAGGVYVMVGPNMHIKTSQSGMLSPDGRCYTFDQRANGFVPGEGVGVVMLKRLADAQKDKDVILGVIQGWGINQDGKTNGITAPNPESQMRLEQEVYDKFKIDPETISYIETHGTGTKLGDPIEIDALKQAFKKYTERKKYCAIGSVKTNIGHCLSAAGVSGFIKILLALKYKQLPPSINFSRLNEHIFLDDSPFYVNTELQEWKPETANSRERLAAISSFGFSGTNAHLVISEYRPLPEISSQVSIITQDQKIAIPLSARTEEQLKQKAQDLLGFLRKEGSSIDLVALAYTLQVGREPMEERLGFMVNSIEQFSCKLESYINGEKGIEDFYQGQVKNNKKNLSIISEDDDMKEAIIDKYIAKNKVSNLLDLWIKGLDLDWNRLYGDVKPRRIALPVYPFARKRYWFDSDVGEMTHTVNVSSAALHPLLHQNTSDLFQQSYRSTFNGEEPFVLDYRLKTDSGAGKKALPPFACLEMVRFAVEKAMPDFGDNEIELKNTVWALPIVVEKNREVSIALFPDRHNQINYEIYTFENNDEVVHCQGQAILTPKKNSLKLNLEEIKKKMEGGKKDILNLYADFNNKGLYYGPVYRGLTEIYQAERQSIARARLPMALNSGRNNFTLHPGLIECAFQVAVALNDGLNDAFSRVLPATLEFVLIHSACPEEIFIYARSRQSLYAKGVNDLIDIDLCDIQGNICVQIKGLSFQPTVIEMSEQYTAPVMAVKNEPAQHQVIKPLDHGYSIEQLQEQLKTSLANALYMNTDEVDMDKSFVEMGIDSIIGVEWIKAINQQYNLELPATKIYDYPTVRDLASFLHNEFKKAAKECSPSVEAAVITLEEQTQVLENTIQESSFPVLKKTSRRHRFVHNRDVESIDKIAIVGMSGRYPQAENMKKYWDNLVIGRNSITEIPASRWDVDKYFDPDPSKIGKIYCKWLGMLDNADSFDPLFFRISPAEAETMDPQQRIFLEESYKAFEDAGYSRTDLSNKKCGVYLGIMGNEYASILAKSKSAPISATGNSFSIAAARIAYFLNLKGPAVAFDTACSSSLVAIHYAYQALLNHEVDMALAGGVSLYLTPETYIGMCQAGMLSPDGQCKTFDDSANGFVPGEGVGAVVLKRLEDAKIDNDFIYGVILGSGLNQDGKTNGITAPSVSSQISLERELYSKYKIDPETISYIETHGTGTKLGDPIELQALSTVFQEKTSRKNFCALGSVKTNIGHTSGAAGVASVQKVLLSMQHKTIVPSINIMKENAHFNFKDSPFYISRETNAWEVHSGSLRRAAVSAFGYSGTNAHLVIEEYPQTKEQNQIALNGQGVKVIIPLSAKHEKQLKQKAMDLLDFIRITQENQARTVQMQKSIDLVNMAYTLQVGREAMDLRLGFVVGSLDELKQKLQAYIDGGAGTGDTYQGRVKKNDDELSSYRAEEDLSSAIEKWIAENKLSKLLELWVKGLDFDWNILYGDVRPGRVSLPVYPFARDRYWVDMNTGTQTRRSSVSNDAIHPLLHTNTSKLNQQCYTSVFSGEEFFISDHQVNIKGGLSQKVMPAAAYLEMANIAVEQAMSDTSYSIIELRQVEWGQPITIHDDKKLSIALYVEENGAIGYEIYSPAGNEETIHCQGQVALNKSVTGGKLDIEQFKGQMRNGLVQPDEVYSALNGMGVNYGTAYRVLKAIYRGEGQILAELVLSPALEGDHDAYKLHPSLVDGAFQASIALIQDMAQFPGVVSLPSSVESIRVILPCTKEMFAFVRYSQGFNTGNRIFKIDIDLCDLRGNICSQMRGVAYQENLLRQIDAMDANPVQNNFSSAETTLLPLNVSNRGKEFSDRSESPDISKVVLKKPATVTLTAPGALSRS